MSPLNITQPLDSIRYMVYNGYYKVMSNIPKMGHLPTPEKTDIFSDIEKFPTPVRGVAVSSNIAVPCHVFGVDVQILHLSSSREAWKGVGLLGNMEVVAFFFTNF